MEQRRTRKTPTVVEQGTVLKVMSCGFGVEKEDQRVLDVRKFETEPAYVRVNAGVTKNMGNYESLRLDVSISMPCYVEEIDEVQAIVADSVADFLDAEIKNYIK